MYPILFCSIVSVAILFERLFALRKSRIISNRDLLMHLAEKGSWDELKETTQKNDDFDRFGENFPDGRLVEQSSPKPFNLRGAILLSKKLGRPLTESEMKQFEID